MNRRRLAGREYKRREYKHSHVIPDARSAIRNPGATVAHYDPLGSGLGLRPPRNDGVIVS